MCVRFGYPFWFTDKPSEDAKWSAPSSQTIEKEAKPTDFEFEWRRPMVKTYWSEEKQRADTKSAPRFLFTVLMSQRIQGPSKKRFDEVYQTGRRFRGDFVTLIQSDGTGFIGIATSKKIGDKPERNFQKRRVKSILQSFQRTSAHDLIFVASIKTKGIKFETLRADLTQLIQEANINWGRK